MKKGFLLLLLLVQALPILPPTITTADHLNPPAIDFRGGAELAIKLDDESVQDATITWKRQQDVPIEAGVPGFDINSGELVFDGTNDDFGPHYHSPVKVLVTFAEGSAQSCDSGSINTLHFFIRLNGSQDSIQSPESVNLLFASFEFASPRAGE